jgi:hypothetical protein
MTIEEMRAALTATRQASFSAMRALFVLPVRDIRTGAWRKMRMPVLPP